jgi:hypothetical protein
MQGMPSVPNATKRAAAPRPDHVPAVATRDAREPNASPAREAHATSRAPSWRSELELLPGDFLPIADALHIFELALSHAGNDAAAQLTRTIAESWEALRPHYDARRGHPRLWQRPLAISTQARPPEAPAAVLVPMARELWSELGARGIVAGTAQHDVDLYLPRGNVANFACGLDATTASRKPVADQRARKGRGRRADPDGLDERCLRFLMERAPAEPRLLDVTWGDGGKMHVEQLGWTYVSGENVLRPEGQAGPRFERSAMNAWKKAQDRVRSEAPSREIADSYEVVGATSHDGQARARRANVSA